MFRPRLLGSLRVDLFGLAVAGALLLLGLVGFLAGGNDGGQPRSGRPPVAGARADGAFSPGAASAQRTPLVRVDEGPPPRAVPDEVGDAGVRLVSSVGATVEAVWLKRGGHWSVHHLEQPGVAPRGLIEGAELVAPVGHLPERAVLDGGPMVFAPWSRLEVLHAPEGWAADVSVAAPVLPDPKEAWKVLATGRPDATTWVCVLQPSASSLEEPQGSLRSRTFPFELRVGGRTYSVELSLARGTVLTIDHRDLDLDLDTRDLPIVLQGLARAVPWTVEMVTDAAGAHLGADRPLLGSGGRVQPDFAGRRTRHFEATDRGTIPDVVVGTFAAVLARADDHSWFAFAPRRVVAPEGELVLRPEPAIELIVTGLRSVGAMNQPLHLQWWFQSPGRGNEREGPVGDRAVEVGEEDSVMVAVTPTLWQAIVLDGKPLTQSALGVTILLGDRQETRVFPIPSTRRIEFPVEGLAEAGFAVTIRVAPDELAEYGWIQFAAAHPDDELHRACRLSAPIVEVEPGAAPGTAVVRGRDVEGDFRRFVEASGLPEWLVLEGREDDLYLHREGADYVVIPTAEVELDLHTRRSTGEWTISWAFGCARNAAFPLSGPVTVESLPRRVVFEVPVTGVLLYVDDRRVGPLVPPGPVSVSLE